MSRKNVAHEAGFSLMEVLITLAIIGLLLAVVSPRIMNQFDRSKVVAAQAQARELAAALDMYRLDIGRYPTPAEGLSVLITSPSGEREGMLWGGPYLEDLPVDPWGNAFGYEPSESLPDQMVIISYGADGAPGGSGLDADISASTS
jgi:general secretion pathway protein G